MDVCSLIGPEQGVQVISLASALLATPNVSGHFSEPHRLISQINGETKDPNAFAQQRYPGSDLMRLVRRPIFRLLGEETCFEVVFLSALRALYGGDKNLFRRYSADRPCCLVVYKDSDMFIEALKDHATHAIPAPVQAEAKIKWTVYLSPNQMFTFLVMLIHTKKSRETFVQDMSRNLYDGDGSWMAQHTILTSLRVSLSPFLQWIQVRGDPKLFKETFRHPRSSEISYLPTCEDSCVLTRTEKLEEVGQLFSSLVPIELVNWIVHQKDGGYFAGHAAFFTWRTAPKIAAKPVDLLMVVFYYFFQLSLRAIATSSNVSAIRLLSFPQFIRLAVSVLSRDDWISAVKYPQAIKEQLESMRGSLATGSFGGKSSDRTLIAMLQIAVVFRERERLVPAAIRHQLWDYAPVQTFPKEQWSLLSPHCSPSPPLGEFGAIMVKDCSAEVLQRLLYPFLAGAAKHEEYDLRMHFVNFVHAEYTNSEVATLILVPDDKLDTGLQALQIYMQAAAVLSNPSSKETGDSAQMLTGFLGSLLTGGPLLFHWLNIFHRVFIPGKPGPLLDLELNSDDDDDEEKEDATDQDKQGELQNALPVSADAQERIRILCEPGFVAKLLQHAIKADAAELLKLQAIKDRMAVKANKVPQAVEPDHVIFKHTLQRIVMMCSPRICIGCDGLRNLNSLNKAFYDAMFDSVVYLNWSVSRKTDLRECFQLAPPKKWFTNAPVLFVRDGMISDMKPDELPQDTVFDDKLLLWIMRDIASDLKADATAATGLRKFSQLRPVSHLSPSHIKIFFPWLDHRMPFVLTPKDVQMEYANPATVGHMYPIAVPSCGEQQAIADIFGVVCGLQMKDVPAAAVASRRLFLRDRTSAEILRPVNLQMNIFRTDLARIGAQLVSDLMFTDGAVDGLKFSTPLIREAGKIKTRGDDFMKAKNKRTKIDHPAPAPAAAAAPSSAAPRQRAPSSAASAAPANIYADNGYSPTYPASSPFSPVYSPSIDPSDEWKHEQDTSRVHQSAAQMDPASYGGGGGAAASKRKRRAGHD